jgi:UPF0716 protein FxsA
LKKEGAMLFKLFVLFLAVPFVEVILLIKMASVLGFWTTLGIQVATAVIGAALARLQGWMVWARIQGEIRAGRLPAGEMADALLIFIAGMALLTPGLISDALGLLILFPPTRNIFKRWLRRRFEKMIFRRSTRIIDVVSF